MIEVCTGDILDVKTGKYDANHAVENGKYQFFTCALKPFKADTFAFDDEVIILPGNGANVGEVLYYKGKLEAYQRTYILHNIKEYPRYLYYYFKKNWIRQITKRQVGSATNYIKMDDIVSFKIPLPPLPIQKKIAAILDEADLYRQKTKVLIAKYDELTQSLFLDMFGDPVTNPKGWDVEELQKVTSKIGSGATPRGGKEAYKEKGISLIRSMNVYDNSFKYKNLAFIDDEQAAKLKNVTVEVNDVLFNITGASICRSTIVPKDILPARVNQHVSILRPIEDKLNPMFLSHFLISKNVKKKLLGVGAGGGAVMEAITKEQLQKINIIKPDLDIQNEFEEKIRSIESQKAQAQEEFAKADNLFNSLLQKAFKGELV